MRATIPTAAADYPTKLVRMIEPFGPGSGPEVIATAVSRKLAELWGQPVTVENHPGAGSTAAPAMVAKSAADGYTLLVHTNAHAYSAALVTNLPYDPVDGLRPSRGAHDSVLRARRGRDDSPHYRQRADRCGEGKAGGAAVRVHRRGHGHAPGDREIQSRGRHQRHPRPRARERCDRRHDREHDRRAHRLRAVADPDHPAAYPRGQTPAARREQRSALERATRRSDGGGGGRPRLRFPDLVRDMGAGRHSSRSRSEARRGHRARSV